MDNKLLTVVLILAILLAGAGEVCACPGEPPVAVLTANPDTVFLGNSVELDGSGQLGLGFSSTSVPYATEMPMP